MWSVGDQETEGGGCNWAVPLPLLLSQGQSETETVAQVFDCPSSDAPPLPLLLLPGSFVTVDVSTGGHGGVQGLIQSNRLSLLTSG